MGTHSESLDVELQEGKSTAAGSGTGSSLPPTPSRRKLRDVMARIDSGSLLVRFTCPRSPALTIAARLGLSVGNPRRPHCTGRRLRADWPAVC